MQSTSGQGRFEARFSAALLTKARLADADKLGMISVQVDRTQFAEQYEQSVLSLENLTPHQRAKLHECRGCQRVHIKAPAGAGKTYLALYEMLDVLRSVEGGSVLFVTHNAPLAYFVARWLCERTAINQRNRLLARLHVMHDPLGQGPRTVIVDKRGVLQMHRLESEGVSGTYYEYYEEYTMVVVDEAHHVYKDDDAKALVAKRIPASARLVLLSDISQSMGDDIDFPADLTEVRLGRGRALDPGPWT